MPKLSFRGYHAFVDWIASPVWNKVVCPFYAWTTLPVINAVKNALGMESALAVNATLNATEIGLP